MCNTYQSKPAWVNKKKRISSKFQTRPTGAGTQKVEIGILPVYGGRRVEKLNDFIQ